MTTFPMDLLLAMAAKKTYTRFVDGVVPMDLLDDLCGNIRRYWGQQCSFLESSSSQKKGGSVHLEGPSKETMFVSFTNRKWVMLQLWQRIWIIVLSE